MQLKAGAVAVLVGLFLATGCTSTTVGLAVRDPKAICAAEGFEDLRADDPGCGKPLDIQGLVPGLAAREVDVNGHAVPYIIDPSSLDQYLAPMDLTVVVARSYPHTVIFDVQRYKNMDIVQINASDTCPVEDWYNVPIPMRDGCKLDNEIISGRSLTAEEAARVISQPFVDRIEQVARDANRFTNYELVLAS